MKKWTTKLVALCLVLCLTLSGCGILDLGGYFDQLLGILGGNFMTSFEDMAYTRPDMQAFRTTLQEGLDAAKEEDLSTVVSAVNSVYAQFDAFYTAYALSNIHYSLDLLNTYWEEEYNFCTENLSEINAGLDSFYRALAKSPIRDQLEGDDYFGPGFFDAYEGETLYDETFQSLLDQEAQLQNQYYALSAQAGTLDPYSEAFYAQCGNQLAEIFVELIRVRQKMAAHADYGDFQQFAYDFYFGRDYTPQQADAHLEDIRRELVPLYQELANSGYWNNAFTISSQKATFDYVKTAATAMGGTVAEAFEAMEAGGLYDISYSPNKFANSFEIYINSYYAPYVFLSPTNTNYDKLAFAHEFGHFCADYASFGSMAGVDVAEVFSQGLEYLSLCYVDDPDLRKLKMADCLRVYVEQAAYASFEQQVYGLEGDLLTVENVRGIFSGTMSNFGLDDGSLDSRSFVLVPHFYVSAQYIISYVFSNDVALQLYMMEKEAPGTGLACLTDHLATTHCGIQAFVQESGSLKSPFSSGWISEVKTLLEKELK